MKYLVLLEDNVKICDKKQFAIKPTKEFTERFCDFCNKSKAYTIGVLCNEPEKYYNFIETIVMNCKMLFDLPDKDFRLFFTKDIITDELIKKLEDLQEIIRNSRVGKFPESYIWCHFLRKNRIEGKVLLQRLGKSKLKFGLQTGYYGLKNMCSFVSESSRLTDAYCSASDTPLEVYENEVCYVYPDGSIRFIETHHEYFNSFIEIGNIWEDDCLSDAEIKQRLDELGVFLKENNLLYQNREFFCENVCSRFRVTKQGIYRDNELMKEF